MKIKLFQRGFNFSQDGPGNRLVFHMQGCNMLCPWCANPEGIAMDGVAMVTGEDLSKAFCPHGAISAGEINRVFCTTCNDKSCIHEYRNRHLSFPCTEYDIKDLVREASESRSLFIEGGGITLSGGEPAMQFEAMLELLQELKTNEINTAIETNATHPKLSEAFKWTDLLILDLKSANDVKHQAMTGITNRTIKKNIKAALQLHPHVWIRIPLIEGYNTSEDDLEEFIEFFISLDTTRAFFEFLPYHEYGKKKWQQCGYPYTVVSGKVAPEKINCFEQQFDNNRLRIIHT